MSVERERRHHYRNRSASYRGSRLSDVDGIGLREARPTVSVRSGQTASPATDAASRGGWLKKITLALKRTALRYVSAPVKRLTSRIVPVLQNLQSKFEKLSPFMQRSIHALVALVVFGSIIFPVLRFDTARAATAVLRPDGDVSAGWGVTGSSCAGAHWCTVDDAVTSPTAGDFTDNINSSGATDRYTMTTATNVATATQIIPYAHHRETAGGSNNFQVSMSVYIGGTQVGTTYACTNSTTTAAWCAGAAINGSWTQAQLDSLEIEVSLGKNGGGKSSSVEVSAVYADVTYTQSMLLDQSSYRWFENVDTATAGSSSPVQAGTVTSADLDGAYDVHVSGNYAYVASGTADSLSVIDITDPTNPTQVGTVTSVDLDRPYAVHVSGNYAYVASNNANSLTVIDISDPTNPTQVGTVTSADLDSVYDVHVSGNYAYVVSTIADSLTVIDITDPTNPTQVGTVTSADLDRPYDVHVSGNYAYVASSIANSLTVIDITDPTTPTQVGAVTSNDFNSAYAVHVSGTYAYVTGGYDAETDSSLTVIDISDPTNPTQTGTVTSYLNPAYDVHISGDYAYVTGYLADALTVIDITDPTTPTQVGTITSAGLDGAQAVHVSGNYAYVASATADALTVINVGLADIGDPLAAQDTVATAPTEGTPFRLRTSMHVDTATLDAGMGNFKLQYAQRNGLTCDTNMSVTDEAYEDVGSGAASSSEGPYFPSTGTTAGTSAYGEWTNATNVTSDDSSVASVTVAPETSLQKTSNSNTLRTGGHGFNIPSNATVDRIDAEIAGSMPTSTRSRFSAYLYSGGSSIGSSQSVSNSTVANVSWDVGLGASVINAADFGVSMVGYNSYGMYPFEPQASVTFEVDYVKVTIQYSVPAEDISFFNNTSVADGAGITSSADDPTHLGHTGVNQSYVESNNFTNPNAIPAGQDGLWDFALVDNDAPGDTYYCFRIVNSDGSPLASYTVIPEIKTSSPLLNHGDYRWFANQDSDDVGIPLAAENTPATLSDQYSDFRLRSLVDVSNKDLPASSLKLQYAPRVGACDVNFLGEIYTDVSAVESSESDSAVNYKDNPVPSDGSTPQQNANDPIGIGPVNVQSYVESNPFAASNISKNESGMWDFALQSRGGLGGSYCFRVVGADGSLLDSYSAIPEIFIPPRPVQIMRHGRWFDAGEQARPFYW